MLITSFRFVFYVCNCDTTRIMFFNITRAMHQLRICFCIIVCRRFDVNKRRCIWLHQFATFRTIIFVVAMCALWMIETHISTRVCIFTHCFVRIRVVCFDDVFHVRICRFDICICICRFVDVCVFTCCQFDHIISCCFECISFLIRNTIYVFDVHFYLNEKTWNTNHAMHQTL